MMFLSFIAAYNSDKLNFFKSDKVAKGGSLPGRTLFFSPFNSDLPLPYDENDCLQGYFIHFASNSD